jgi:hypothetical protein
MSPSRCRAKKTTTKILGEGKYGKPKAPTIIFQLHLSLIYLHCATN